MNKILNFLRSRVFVRLVPNRGGRSPTSDFPATKRPSAAPFRTGFYVNQQISNATAFIGHLADYFVNYLMLIDKYQILFNDKFRYD